MKKNMGKVDRTIRSIIALIFAVLIFTKTVTGILAIVFGIFALIFILTSFVSFCPLYSPFKISTLKEEKTNK